MEQETKQVVRGLESVGVKAKPKVLFLNPPSKHGVAVVRDTLYGCWCKGRANYLWPPTMLAQLGAIVEEAGFDVFLIDAMAQKLFSDEIKQKILEIKPKYVIINTATITFSGDVEIIKAVKESFPDLKVVFTGTHVTSYPVQTLKEKTIDFIVLGEPDLVLRNLLIAVEAKEDLRNVKGIGFVDSSGKTIITGMAEQVDSLDELPFPARHLIPKADYFNPLAKRLPYATIFSSRGCPGGCTFCTAIIMYGRKFKPRSAKKVVDEIELLVKDDGIKEIFFRDETFTLNKQRVLDICDELLKRKIDVTWIANSRVDSVDEEMLVAMKKAGCHLLKFGVESGSQQILNNIKKGITVERTRETFRLCKKIGIDTVAHIMFGNPGETKETMEETLKFVFEIDPTYASFNITAPYPGTELWKTVEDRMEVGLQGDFSSYDIERTLENTTFNHLWCNLTKEELNDFYNKAYSKFYFRPKYILRRMGKLSSWSDVVRTGQAGLALLFFNLKNRFVENKKQERAFRYAEE